MVKSLHVKDYFSQLTMKSFFQTLLQEGRLQYFQIFYFDFAHIYGVSVSHLVRCLRACLLIEEIYSPVTELSPSEDGGKT